MLTDWVLILRLAREIEQRLGAARVTDAGLLPDGRIAILFRQRGGSRLLVLDLFGSPPLVTVEESELGIGVEPGFARTLARSLRGMLLVRAEARRHDRTIRLAFQTRSRFGVTDALELYVELVPRFGNAVLVKDGIVVAAHKEFAPSQNARRDVQAGAAYALPPIPLHPRVLGTPPPLDEDRAASAPLYVYRRNGAVLQAYMSPLSGFEDALESREGSLLEVFAELRAQQAAESRSARDDVRRRAILHKLDKREAKARRHLATLAAQRERALARDVLRAEAEGIYASLHERSPAERDAAKKRAAALFGDYKKLGKSLPHIEAREQSLRGALEAVENLRWETERAAGDDLDAVESALGERESARGGAKSQAVRRKRPLLELKTPSGSRILVGRSPVENSELTFHVARPNDLWFHAQRIPGAHVILTREDRQSPPPGDLELAASIAAYHSRGRLATSVAVDYTLRKHVRRRATPGLVWYTHAKTIVAKPQPIEPPG